MFCHQHVKSIKKTNYAIEHTTDILCFTLKEPVNRKLLSTQVSYLSMVRYSIRKQCEESKVLESRPCRTQPPSPNIQSSLSMTTHDGSTRNSPNAASVRVRALMTFAAKKKEIYNNLSNVKFDSLKKSNFCFYI